MSIRGADLMAEPVPSLQDPERLQELIDEYFEKRWDTRTLISSERDANGERIRIEEKYMRPPTYAGLADHLGTTRMSLWRYQKRGREKGDACYSILARALNRIAQFAEEALYTREGSTGARFALEVNHRYGREDDGGGTGEQFIQQISPPVVDGGEPLAIPKWEDDA